LIGQAEGLQQLTHGNKPLALHVPTEQGATLAAGDGDNVGIIDAEGVKDESKTEIEASGEQLVSEVEPAGHDGQLHGMQVEIDVAPIAVLKVVFGHKLQDAAPLSLHDPAAHKVQVSFDIAPKALLHVPGGHNVTLAA